MTSAPVRLGILGAANIARLFVEAVRPSRKIAVTAVASRETARASAFASDLGIGRTHASYDALVADPDIDAVYVPPHTTYFNDTGPTFPPILDIRRGTG